MPDRLSSNSLVIGGTGMLAQATSWLAANSTRTLLVARRASHFARNNPGVVPLDLNWNDASFRSLLSNAIERIRPIGRALLWLHSPEAVLPWLLPLLDSASTVLVLGSMDGRPEISSHARQIAAVRLGSMPMPGGRRWLTHDEISDAAIAALRDGQSRIVGELRGVG